MTQMNIVDYNNEKKNNRITESIHSLFSPFFPENKPALHTL